MTDTGHGMTPEVMARAFEESFTTKPVGQGRGIGLFLCKTLVEQAGGRIELASIEGAGSTVEPSPADRRHATDDSMSKSTLNVLVIDDEAALRQIVAATLSKAGYAVEQASCVAEGRSRLARGDIDVALCDIKMPDGTGIELLRESKAAGIATVFVMVTASASMETAVDALRPVLTTTS